MEDIKEQLIDLQTRLAYQEDTLSQLDAVTIRQAAQIDSLEMALRQLSERLSKGVDGDAAATGYEQPPHY
jgi:SlyX protein